MRLDVLTMAVMMTRQERDVVSILLTEHCTAPVIWHPLTALVSPSPVKS